MTMNFKWEKPTIRLYKYYFLGIPKPVTIQAYNKVEARDSITRNWSKLAKPYQVSNIIGETVTIPLFGVTEREENNVKYLWVGKSYSSTGWMKKEDFDKKFGSVQPLS